ncbi:hypothetical protein H2200_006804 [Cladophialophora chaetospira]|uniref:Uncharacterized protein n=1 Tax=Cladophialophora chaetospira TaxID=386627 RepID=A0AA38X8W8_9EURO|nr:hypothetical protein H2200_006804 [Cladophialophora chaetospira]
MRCYFNNATISAILSTPTALTSFGLKSRYIPHRGDAIRAEAQILQHVLAGLAKWQPQVKTLNLGIQYNGIISSDLFQNTFDFAQLTSLKELVISNRTGGEMIIDGSFHYLSWCPINVFDRLPSGLECLQLRPNRGPVELNKLADLICQRCICLPEALRLECYTIEPHLRPLKEVDQAIDQSHIFGIEKFMTQCSLPRLIYVQAQHSMGGEESSLLSKTTDVRRNADGSAGFAMSTSYETFQWSAKRHLLFGNLGRLV